MTKKIGQKIFVTGAAGFIGSNLVDTLLQENYSVVGFDNYSTGQKVFLKTAMENPSFQLMEGDCLDRSVLSNAMKGCDCVFHLSANADIRFGLDHPEKDLQQNTLATFNVLEAMRKNSIRKIAFSSTGSVYGDAVVIPTPEDAPFPIQTSLYGASKLAGESLIQAYCEGFQFQAFIFRFVSILGDRYTHGHIFDFYKQLLKHPEELTVLGNGNQKKSYLHVQDCIGAMLHVMREAESVQEKSRVKIYNLGTQEYCQVTDSIQWICDYLSLAPKIIFRGGSQGWIGDNPFIFLDTSKICSTGWKARYSIQQGVLSTLIWLKANQWVLTVR